jgi:hypothetical protein
MKRIECKFETGCGGFWLLPLIAFSWRNKQFIIWFAWLYWMVGIEINNQEVKDDRTRN